MVIIVWLLVAAGSRLQVLRDRFNSKREVHLRSRCIHCRWSADWWIHRPFHETYPRVFANKHTSRCQLSLPGFRLNFNRGLCYTEVEFMSRSEKGLTL